MTGHARPDARPAPGPADGRVPAGGLPARELLDRAHASSRLMAAFATIAMPAWTLFDALLEPDRLGALAAVRLVGVVPMLLLVWLLWRRPVGRRRPELLAYLVLALAQVEIAWMLPRVDNVEFYLLGFTLALYGSGCLLVARPTWTAGLVVTSWSALGAAVATAPSAMAPRDLAAAAIYLATASAISLLAHQQRHRLTVRELTARVGLEQEQEHTRLLLQEMDRLSHEDALTGLANRRRWDAELAAACAADDHDRDQVALVLVDVDRFKEVNDRYGHAGGDRALCEVAKLLTGRVRAGDLVARLGGDEFALLLPGADADRAVALAEELRRDAARLQPPGFAAGEISLSLGVAVATRPGASPQDLQSDADTQLYCAKVTRNAVGAAAGS